MSSSPIPVGLINHVYRLTSTCEHYDVQHAVITETSRLFDICETLCSDHLLPASFNHTPRSNIASSGPTSVTDADAESTALLLFHTTNACATCCSAARTASRPALRRCSPATRVLSRNEYALSIEFEVLPVLRNYTKQQSSYEANAGAAFV